MLKTGATVAAALVLVVVPGGSAAADPTECQVVSFSGRCLVAAVDPGRPGGPLTKPTPRTDPSSRRPAATQPATDPAVRRAREAAERYAETLRAQVLGLPLPPAAPAPAAAGAQRAAAAAQAARSVQRAVEELDLPAGRIGLSAAGRGFVGAPVWLWLEGGAAVTGPTSATAAVGAASVTATARLASVEWSLGPPGARVVCAGPGTPWAGQPGPSPDCGYVYAQRSLPERTGGTGRWPIAATAHWQVDWQGVSGGVPVAGQQTVELTSRSDLAVGELQALVAGSGS